MVIIIVKYHNNRSITKADSSKYRLTVFHNIQGNQLVKTVKKKEINLVLLNHVIFNQCLHPSSTNDATKYAEVKQSVIYSRKKLLLAYNLGPIVSLNIKSYL